MKLCKNGHSIGTVEDCIACKRSRAAKKRWENPSKAMVASSKANRKLTTTEGLKSKEAKEKRKNYFSSDLHKKRARASAKRLAEERRSGDRLPLEIKKFNTKPELAVKAVLESHGINYVQQYKVGPYSFDFGLPDYKKLIEVQGEYWHSLPNNIDNDLAKESFVRSQFPDHSIIYISELESLKRKSVQAIIEKATGKTIKSRDINLSEIQIKEVQDEDAASRFLAKFHYLPRFRKKTKGLHGCFIGEELIGLIIYSTPSYNNVASREGIKSSAVVELARFVIAEDCHAKNLASKFISKSLKLLKRSHPDIGIIVSYSDPHFGYDGRIYEASNWDYDGDTPPSYYYADANGNIIHKKTIWDHAKKMKVSEKEYANQNKLKKIITEPKRRFLYRLRAIDKIQKVKKPKEVTCIKCKDEFNITEKAWQLAFKKHNGYLCLSCSIKKNWEKGYYNNRPKRIESNPKRKVTVECDCGYISKIQQKSLNNAIRKNGKYVCNSCAIKKAHKNGKYG